MRARREAMDAVEENTRHSGAGLHEQYRNLLGSLSGDTQQRAGKFKQLKRHVKEVQANTTSSLDVVKRR